MCVCVFLPVPLSCPRDKVIFSNLFVDSILHYCSLHRNAQYGLVPFMVFNWRLKVKNHDYWTDCEKLGKVLKNESNVPP